MNRPTSVAVIGAGPHGLAAAAHLRHAGVDVRVFGEPMVFWQRSMPAGMFLRSASRASSISSPNGTFSLTRFEAAHGIAPVRPVPLDEFIRYGLWFQREAVPEIDTRRVTRVEAVSGGFRLALEDGELVEARRVAVAAGIEPFAWRPPMFDELPAELCSHTVEHRDFDRFAGAAVAVIGGGQSATESAALLNEAGARVEVLVRASFIHWIGHEGTATHGPLKRAAIFLLWPPSDVGPPGWNWIVATPDLYRTAPKRLQEEVVRRAIPPRAANWLKPRLVEVPIRLRCSVTSLVRDGDRVRLGLDDGSTRVVDHVMLGTGFKLDIAGYSFLSPDLVRSIRKRDGYPLLRPGMESSVPGLHFLGAPAAASFGPVLRFVSGSTFGARSFTRRVLGRRPLPISFSF